MSKDETVTHTPGPWRVRNYRTKKGALWIDSCARDERGKALAGTVAEVYATGTGSHDPAVQEANALLIAAAPDLLSACRSVATWCEAMARGGGLTETTHIHDLALDAIAKAKGEPVETHP